MKLVNSRSFHLITTAFILVLILVGWGYVFLTTKYSADGGYSDLTPKKASDFVQSIGVTTHLTYSDYQSNQYFPDLFNQLIGPKVHQLGISNLRQFPTEVETDFTGSVSKFNKLSRDGPTQISFNWETSIETSSNSNPQHTCYLPKIKYLVQGTSLNCGGLANLSTSSNIATASVENPNEPDHCASFICGQSTTQNWFSNSLSRNPDWPDDVLATAQAAYTKITSDPATRNLEILAPAFVWLPYHINETYRGVNLKTYLAPLKNYITYGNAHPYCHLLSVANCYATEVQPAINYYAPKPVIVTETGYSTANYTERQQAKYLPRILFDFFERGIPRTYIYELLDEPSAATPTERNFGLLDENGREKTAFVWLKNAITLLKDNGSVTLTPLEASILGPASLRTSLLKKSDGSYWLALQNDKATTTDTDVKVGVTLSFSTPRDIQYFNLESTEPYSTVTNVSSAVVSVPDRIILAKITLPAATTTNSGGSASTNTNSGGSSSTNTNSGGSSSKETTTENQSGKQSTSKNKAVPNGSLVPSSSQLLPELIRSLNEGFSLPAVMAKLQAHLSVSVWQIVLAIVGTVLIITSVTVIWLRHLRKKRK